jgi:hypothetical protein
MEQDKSDIVLPRIESQDLLRNETSDVVQLDPEGDAVLIVDDAAHITSKKFLVSSKVLSLASPVFSRMFGSNFREGIQTRQGNPPSIPLKEDDPDAVESILSLLHFRNLSIPDSMGPERLAMLAIQCGKYDCNGALRPWIALWCDGYQNISSPEDFGFMLLAAYLFRSTKFPYISAKAAKALVPDFVSKWGKQKILALLPERVTGLTPSRRC